MGWGGGQAQTCCLVEDAWKGQGDGCGFGDVGLRQTGGTTTGSLTVGEASGHAGRGERVALLGVHEVAHRRQLVHLSMGGGAGAEGGLRWHGGSEAAERRRLNENLHNKKFFGSTNNL